MSDFATIITRLALCDGDLTAYLKASHKYPPLTLDGDADHIPMAWHEPDGMSDDAVNNGTAEQSFRVTKFVITHAVSNQDMAAGGYASQLESITAIHDAVVAYYNDHRKLHTTTGSAQGNLAGLWREIGFTTEIGTVTSRDGTVYVGFRMNFTVYISKSFTPKF